jgi:hypothetical protein
MNRWWCMDCRSAVDLDRHGRCEGCESEAVDSFNPGNAQATSGSVSGQAATNSVSCS